MYREVFELARQGLYRQMVEGNRLCYLLSVSDASTARSPGFDTFDSGRMEVRSACGRSVGDVAFAVPALDGNRTRTVRGFGHMAWKDRWRH